MPAVSHQLDLFAPVTLPKRANPFTHIQGVNLFGTRAIYIGCWICTGSDLVRPGYAESEA